MIIRESGRTWRAQLRCFRHSPGDEPVISFSESSSFRTASMSTAAWVDAALTTEKPAARVLIVSATLPRGIYFVGVYWSGTIWHPT